ncbi:diguanylate cyclase [Actinoplanes sp. SE50]|uniref:PAS domain-containing protein n=1 Tax=unclassified Actinoplanes TaxID=2626549 RepID=UPI00023EBB0B|nr:MULTISPECIES: PAS domain-containing protein [unclassified Actinoplanes]AEV82297.1 diguanylate cyclase [Actinoplanes sp. SE50/110]ATO80694.1 diguanylate cyclase [Actinoplanes sp. SE50]SLL98101.1 diguanylate cyclase [Actinoplanes sp. SE50/110]
MFWGALEWILLGAGGVGAIIHGVRRHRPARKAPWWLLAGSVAVLAAGDVCYSYRQMGTADIFYLVMFGLTALCLLQFTRGGALLGDRARLIDLLALACSTLLVAWVFMIGVDGRLDTVSAPDVIGDLLLTGVAGRLVGADRRNAAAWLLLAGAAGMLAGDIGYPLARGPLTESAYVVLYLCWGLAALHPSMVRLTEPAPPRHSPWRFRWSVLLTLSACTPPAVLLIEALHGEVKDGLVIAITGALTLLLTITRLADSIRQNSQALSREHALRTATAALVAAADRPAVDAAVRAAVIQLLPPAAIRRVSLADELGPTELPIGGAEPATGPSGRAEPTAGPADRGWWLPAADPDDRTLVCPLRLEPLDVARPSGGALVLTGRREDLIAGRDALEVLAGQAALALDRITLVEAVGRRDSDLYLRAVIRNTADLMAVIDADQRIRYASPALRHLLGQDELPPLATLDELIHPCDRARVRGELRSQGDGTIHCALQRDDQSQVLVELTYRDLRDDRLVQGLVLTLRDITGNHDPVERHPYAEPGGDLPAWVNRRSARQRFRY